MEEKINEYKEKRKKTIKKIKKTNTPTEDQKGFFGYEQILSDAKHPYHRPQTMFNILQPYTKEQKQSKDLSSKDVCEKDRFFMREAVKEANKATHKYTKVGCVIVHNGEIIARGHNHFITDPESMRTFKEQDSLLITKKPYRDLQMIHAEKSALFSLYSNPKFLEELAQNAKNAEQRLGKTYMDLLKFRMKHFGQQMELEASEMYLAQKIFKNLTVYVTHACCSYCLRDLIQVGCRDFVFLNKNTDGNFIDEHQEKANKAMYEASGATVRGIQL